ncbi:MAG: helix-turn-helix domain-containing protein [Chitinophagales bacterium]
MSTKKNIPKNNVSQSVNESDFIEQLQDVILQQIANKNYPLTLHYLAKNMLIGEKTLHRKIKEDTQQTPQQYIQELRLQIAHQAIEEQQYTTTKELAYSFGYSNPSYFAVIFKKRFDYSPKTLILKQKEQQTIQQEKISLKSKKMP